MTKRWKLIDARKRRGMDQTQLGKALGDIPRDTIGRWEDGTQEPRPDMIQKLCDFFAVTHPYELDLHAAFNCASQCGEQELLEMLESMNRRQLTALFSQLSIFAGIDLAAVFSATLVAPDQLLNLCRTVIDQCWLMLDQGSFSLADVLISECVAKLDGLATKVSPFQPQAATLATEATILQMLIVSHQMNYKRLVALGESAVTYGELSDDTNIHILALGYQGDNYKNELHQPDKAIDILSKALPLFGENTLLNQADIALSLSNAYAHVRDETKSRKYLEMAHAAMPEHPQYDPLYRMIGLGSSEIHTRTGNIYLILAKHFPAQKEYPQLAYDAFTKSASTPSLDKMRLSISLIDKAEGAKCMGETHEYLDSLMEGAHIALQVNSQKQIVKATTLLQKTPHAWRTEQKYIELCGLLTPNIVTQ